MGGKNSGSPPSKSIRRGGAARRGRGCEYAAWLIGLMAYFLPLLIIAILKLFISVALKDHFCILLANIDLLAIFCASAVAAYAHLHKNLGRFHLWIFKYGIPANTIKMFLKYYTGIALLVYVIGKTVMITGDTKDVNTTWLPYVNFMLGTVILTIGTMAFYESSKGKE